MYVPIPFNAHTHRTLLYHRCNVRTAVNSRFFSSLPTLAEETSNPVRGFLPGSSLSLSLPPFSLLRCMHTTYVLLLLLPGMFLSLPDDARAVASWQKKRTKWHRPFQTTCAPSVIIAAVPSPPGRLHMTLKLGPVSWKEREIDHR